jgi:hypothetical protein
VVAGTGSRLIGGAMQAELSRDEVLTLFVDGFLPKVELHEKPQKRQSGFQEFGLPYAADAAITKYLAMFLRTHSQSKMCPARPDIVLFNGGFFASPVLRSRLIESLEYWFRTTDSNWSPIVNCVMIALILPSLAARHILAWSDAVSAFALWRDCLGRITSASNRPTDSERRCVWSRLGQKHHRPRQ